MSLGDRVRALFERLPGPASWSPWVGVIIVETANYKPFVQQCLRNTTSLTRSEQGCVLSNHKRNGQRAKLDSGAATASAVHKALGWKRVARIHFRVMIGLYVYHLLKYRLLALIYFDPAFAGLQYLDCFIPGRFRFVGRANKISGEIASTFILWFLIYRLLIELRVPRFKFYALEFLITSHAEIAQNELRAGPGGTFSVEDQERDPSSRLEVNSIFYLRSPFKPHESKWILRPNRTREAWHAINQFSKAIFYWSIYVLVAWFALIYWALAGSVLTNLGFEMSYPACAAWLRDLQGNPSASNNYSHIYRAPRVLAHEIRIDDIPARIPLDLGNLQRATPHSLVRISFDIVGNHLIYLEYVLLFSTQFYMLLLQSIDVGLNARGIRDRLVRLLERLEAQQILVREREARERLYARILEQAREELDDRTEPVEHPVWALPGELALSNKDHNHQLRYLSPPWMPLSVAQNGLGLGEEVGIVQAILADHFDIITRGYSAYISLAFPCMGLCWLHYTLILCAWMSNIKSRAVEAEFLIAESIVTMFCIILMSSSALVRSRNLQLYPLITRAMALDVDWSLTKPRWATLIQYFHPRPFYCFTIVGSTEISWLFCLKLLSWILSAFILLANFFYMDRL